MLPFGLQGAVAVAAKSRGQDIGAGALEREGGALIGELCTSETGVADSSTVRVVNGQGQTGQIAGGGAFRQ